MPFGEVFGVAANVCEGVGKSASVECACAEVAEDVRLHVGDGSAVGVGKGAGEVAAAQHVHKFGREPFLGQRCFEVEYLGAQFQIPLPPGAWKLGSRNLVCEGEVGKEGCTEESSLIGIEPLRRTRQFGQ